MSRNKDDVGFNRDIQSRMCQLEVLLVPLSLLRTNLLRILQNLADWPRIISEKSGYLSMAAKNLTMHAAHPRWSGNRPVCSLCLPPPVKGFAALS